MDFAGNALAPNVLLVKKHLADLSAEWLRMGRPKLDYSFPLRGNKKDKAARIVKFDPAIGLQAGFGFAPFFDNDCRTEIFTDATSLVSVYPNNTSTPFKDAGLIGASPLTIYSTSPFVMMVNEEALSPTPIPHRWEDLLDSRFENKIIITPEATESNVAVLSFYALYGSESGDDALNGFLKYSYLDFAIQIAGGKNVADEADGESYGDVTAEQTATWNPEYIFCGRIASSDAVTTNEAFSGTDAVINGNVYLSPSGVMEWDTGSECVLNTLYLAKTLHPDLFTDLDMVKEIQEYYSTFYNTEITQQQAQNILNRMGPKA